MLGLDYAEQLKQKEAAVRKLVGKYGPVAPIRGAENPCHYRNKVISTFAAGPGGKLVSGIYAAGTHKVLPVESCLLQDEVLDTVMQRCGRRPAPAVTSLTMRTRAPACSATACCGAAWCPGR